MNIAELITEFSTQEILPVDVNDVLDRLRRSGVDDDITFIGADLNPDILQGAIKRFYVRDLPYADPRRCTNIYYHRGHAIDWQRFICCKELVHILDNESGYTSGDQAIDLLAEQIGLPPEMQDPMAQGLEANIDRMAEFRAIALLFPIAARNLLIPPYREGKIAIADIARLADIPARYAAFVMSDGWDKVHGLLARIP